MMTTLFVSAQVALPEWVRGRGLAIFLTVFFGAMTVGSAVWGKVASVEGLSTTLYIAAAGAAVGMILTLRWRLQGAAALDLTPSMHWRTPVFVHRVEDDEGPILLTVEYRIDPADSSGVPGGDPRDRPRAKARRRLCVGSLRGYAGHAAGSSRRSSFSRCSNSSICARG